MEERKQRAKKDLAFGFGVMLLIGLVFVAALALNEGLSREVETEDTVTTLESGGFTR